VNLDGVVCASWCSRTQPHRAYGQIFRDGSLELVGTRLTFGPEDEIAVCVCPPDYEHPMIRYDVAAIVAALAALEIPAPAYACFSLLGVAGCPILVLQSREYQVKRPLPGHVGEIVAPPVYIERWDDNWLAALRPAFDMVWNAVGVDSTQTDFDAADPELRWPGA
jgi:hypothetical protein